MHKIERRISNAGFEASDRRLCSSGTFGYFRLRHAFLYPRIQNRMDEVVLGLERFVCIAELGVAHLLALHIFKIVVFVAFFVRPVFHTQKHSIYAISRNTIPDVF